MTDQKVPPVFKKALSGKIEIIKSDPLPRVAASELAGYRKNPDGTLWLDGDGHPERNPSETIKLEKPLIISKPEQDDH